MNANFGNSPRTQRIFLALVVIAIGLYVMWRSNQGERAEKARPLPPRSAETKPTETKPTETNSAEPQPETSAEASPKERPETPTDEQPRQTRISGVTVRDQEGKVAFRGTVDVAETLQRIERGEKLRFSHDGTVFENRERKLPRQPAGYYREYVHPTEKLAGPGPQRIVMGKQGETYYTHDHYRTFQRLDKDQP